VKELRWFKCRFCNKEFYYYVDRGLFVDYVKALLTYLEHLVKEHSGEEEYEFEKMLVEKELKHLEVIR